MKIIRFLLIIAIVAATASHASASGESPQRIDIQSGEQSRSYLLYVPAEVQPHTTLVVMIHGGGGSAEQAAREYGWNKLADREGFIVLYPDALQRSWNAGDCCGRASQQKIDDVGFIQDAIADARTRVPTTIDHVVMTGMSNGGMMTYRYTCEAGGIDAIGVVAATLVSDCTNPHAVSVMHVHGLADTRVPPDGSVGDGTEHVDGWPIDDVIELWRRVDKCDAPVDTSYEDVHISAATCPDNRQVTLVTIEGFDHGWPGAKRSIPSNFDTTEELWTFFSSLSGS